MFLVGGEVGNPHHHPGHDGGDHVDRAVQRFGDQCERTDSDADDQFCHRHAGTGKDRYRGDAGLLAGMVIAHGCGFIAFSSEVPSGSREENASKHKIRALSNKKASMTARIRHRLTAAKLRIVPILNSCRQSVTTILPRCLLASMCSKALPISANANTRSIGNCSLRASTAPQISFLTSSKISRISSIVRVRKVTPMWL